MRTVELGELVRPAPKRIAGDVVYPVLSMTMRDGLVHQASKFKKTVAGKDLSAYRVVERGQLVVGFPIDEAVLAFQRIVHEGIVSPAYGVWDIVDESSVDRDYLERYLRSSRAISFYKSKLRGSTARRRSLPGPVFKSMPISLPEFPEQRRIADILDRADALHAKRREAIAHLDTLAQSIFHEMFGGRTASATVEGIAASEKSSIRTGPFGSQLLHDEFVDSGVAVLGLDNVVGNEFRWGQRRYITAEKYKQLERYTVHSGDVLISIMGTTGRCVVVPSGVPQAINTKHICAITVDQTKVLPSFLRGAFLWHPESRIHLLRQAKGAIMSGLNMGIIKSMPLPLPPLREQHEFVSRVESIDSLRDCLRIAQETDERLFVSLQERAFKGEL
ncbi:restriction endonuclease subunit S [Zhihengliuella salsuginis]|uniref:restriction endonuclease subunit S n=1 Tax=Zhihengliuella salsuginis TaxID=578222 RepID=UPI001E4429A3|nr:restriction endonuclease subunit S [Zhihengliuella salsuginis]